MSTKEQLLEKFQEIIENLQQLQGQKIHELRDTLVNMRYLIANQMHYLSIVGSVLKDYTGHVIHHLNDALIENLIEQMNTYIPVPIRSTPMLIEEKLSCLKAICSSIKIPSYINILLYEIILSEYGAIPNEVLTSNLLGEELINMYIDLHLHP